jgi:hypothetical protein
VASIQPVLIAMVALGLGGLLAGCPAAPSASRRAVPPPRARRAATPPRPIPFDLRLRKALRKNLREYRRRLRRCHELAMAEDYRVGGRLHLRLRVGPAGPVIGVTVAKNEPGSRLLTRCVIHVVRSFVFPSSDTTHQVSVRLRFFRPKAKYTVRLDDVPARRVRGTQVTAKTLLTPRSVTGDRLALSVVRWEPGATLPLPGLTGAVGLYVLQNALQVSGTGTRSGCGAGTRAGSRIRAGSRTRTGAVAAAGRQIRQLGAQDSATLLGAAVRSKAGKAGSAGKAGNAAGAGAGARDGTGAGRAGSRGKDRALGLANPGSGRTAALLFFAPPALQTRLLSRRSATASARPRRPAIPRPRRASPAGRKAWPRSVQWIRGPSAPLTSDHRIANKAAPAPAAIHVRPGQKAVINPGAAPVHHALLVIRGTLWVTLQGTRLPAEAGMAIYVPGGARAEAVPAIRRPARFVILPWPARGGWSLRTDHRLVRFDTAPLPPPARRPRRGPQQAPRRGPPVRLPGMP